MIIIELMGGLGNQMFQYALALKLKHIGRNVCIDLLFDEDTLRKYELDCFSGVSEAAVPMLRNDHSSGKNGKIQKIIRNVINRSIPVHKDRIILYQPEVYGYKRARLSGYWQNEKYFSDIRDEILKVYSFRDDLAVQFEKALADRYGDQYNPENETSVSVHVRCTDYNNSMNSKLYGNICTLDYYKKAIKYYTDRYKDSVFYFFSDDMNHVREKLLPEIKESNPGTYRMVEWDCDNVADLWLMTKCRHHIIANSTFSWWGAWLGQNEDKTVVAPRLWMNGYSYDIICEDWIKL